MKKDLQSLEREYGAAMLEYKNADQSNYVLFESICEDLYEKRKALLEKQLEILKASISQKIDEALELNLEDMAEGETEMSAEEIVEEALNDFLEEIE